MYKNSTHIKDSFPRLEIFVEPQNTGAKFASNKPIIQDGENAGFKSSAFEIRSVNINRIN